MRVDEALHQHHFFRGRISRGPVGPALRQVPLHRGACPLQSAVRRGHAGAQSVRGLGGGPAEQVACDQGAALAWWQYLQRGEERQGDGFPADRGILRRLLRRQHLGDFVQQRVRVGLQPGQFGERGQPGHAPAGAKRVQADVRRDAVQPCAVGVRSVEAVPAAPGPKERFLHRVLGLVERGQHAVAVHVQFAPVPPGELVELVHHHARSPVRPCSGRLPGEPRCSRRDR